MPRMVPSGQKGCQRVQEMRSFLDFIESRMGSTAEAIYIQWGRIFGLVTPKEAKHA